MNIIQLWAFILTLKPKLSVADLRWVLKWSKNTHIKYQATKMFLQATEQGRTPADCRFLLKHGAPSLRSEPANQLMEMENVSMRDLHMIAATEFMLVSRKESPGGIAEKRLRSMVSDEEKALQTYLREIVKDRWPKSLPRAAYAKVAEMCANWKNARLRAWLEREPRWMRVPVASFLLKKRHSVEDLVSIVCCVSAPSLRTAAWELCKKRAGKTQLLQMMRDAPPLRSQIWERIKELGVQIGDARAALQYPGPHRMEALKFYLENNGQIEKSYDVAMLFPELRPKILKIFGLTASKLLKRLAYVS